MTAPDPRLEEIEARLSKATPGPWEVFGSLSQWETEEGLSFGPDNAPEVGTVTEGLGDANFIAHSPADVAYLLAELRKAQEVLRHAQEVAWAKGATSAGMNLMALQVAGINPNPYRAAVADATGGGE